MALVRYEHTGAAPATGLSVGINASVLSFTALSGTGYPTGAVGKFVIVIDPGTPSEEKVLCTARSGATFTIDAAGRGYDNTTAASHSAGTTNIQHVFAAAEADDDNDHIYTTTRDDHIQYARTDGTRHFTGGVTVNTGGLAVTAGGINVAAGTTAVQAATATTVTATGELKGTDFNATGLTGATAASRYCGATASGAPSSGTFATGDFVIDQTGLVWICTAGGTPGTWQYSIPQTWTNYTPTLTSASGSPAIGNGTLSGAYLQLGKQVTFRAVLTTGTTTTFGTGQLRLSLPVTALSGTTHGVPAAHSDGTNYFNAVGAVNNLLGGFGVAALFTMKAGASQAYAAYVGGTNTSATDVLVLEGAYQAA